MNWALIDQDFLEGGLATLGSLGLGFIFILAFMRYHRTRTEQWKHLYEADTRTRLLLALAATSELGLRELAVPWNRYARKVTQDILLEVEPGLSSAQREAVERWKQDLRSRCRIGGWLGGTHETRLRGLKLGLLSENPVTSGTGRPRCLDRLSPRKLDARTTLLALRLALETDPDAWKPVIDQLVKGRTEWSRNDLVRLLRLLPVAGLERLEGRLARAHGARQYRLLESLLEYDPGKAWLVLQDSSASAEALSRALQKVESPLQKESVLPFLNYPVDFVRLQAAKALGRIGNGTDLGRLRPVLSDPADWVRRRAAESIWKLLPKTDLHDLKNLAGLSEAERRLLQETRPQDSPCSLPS